MKKLIALSFLLFLIGYGKEVDTLLERNGIKYEINSTTPYTGKFKENYYNGKLKVEESYKKGKLEGVYKSYYDNGKLEGVRKRYSATGKLKEKEIYKNGKLLKKIN